MEASGQLAAVEEGALGGLDGAESSARSTANAGLSANSLAQGAVLLDVVAVVAEAGVGVALAEVGGERASGRSRVRLRAVVDVGWKEANMLALSIEDGSAAAAIACPGRRALVRTGETRQGKHAMLHNEVITRDRYVPGAE